MLYIFMGQSCTGKYQVAERALDETDFTVFTGLNYLRLAGNREEAFKIFYQRLLAAADNQEDLIYLVNDPEELKKIEDIDNAIKVKFNSPLARVKEVFKERMARPLTIPIISNIERDYHKWDRINGDINVDSSKMEAEEILEFIDIL